MCMNYLDVGLNLKKVQHILIFKHVHKHTKKQQPITYKSQRPREIDLNCHLYDLIDTKSPPVFCLSGFFSTFVYDLFITNH